MRLKTTVCIGVMNLHLPTILVWTEEYQGLPKKMVLTPTTCCATRPWVVNHITGSTLEPGRKDEMKRWKWNSTDLEKMGMLLYKLWYFTLFSKELWVSRTPLATKHVAPVVVDPRATKALQRWQGTSALHRRGQVWGVGFGSPQPVRGRSPISGDEFGPFSVIPLGLQ